MKLQFILPILLMGLFLFYALYVTKKRKAGMGPAFRMFLERTGYRYADILDRPLEDHILHGEKLMHNAGQGVHVHLVRDFHGVRVHSVQETGRTDDNKGWFVRYSWVVPLSQRPRVLLQIADRRLSSAAKAVKEAFSNSKRHWAPIYSQKVPIADPELERRMVCFAEDPAAAQRVLQTPGLKELLLGCAEVDLTVSPDEVRFADPLQKNMMAGMGGTVCMMALGTNMMKNMELSIPMHDRMAELCATLQRACA